MSSSQASTTLWNYPIPEGFARSEHFRVRINGEEVAVGKTGEEDFVNVAADGPVHVEVEASETVEDGAIQPTSKGFEFELEGKRMSFDLEGPEKVCVRMGHLPLLFVWINPPVRQAPEKGAEGVHYFEAGKIHEVGELSLKTGDTVYLEGGAIVRGCFHGVKTDDVRFCGHGIIDGSCHIKGVNQRRCILIEHSRNVKIEEICMVHPSTWMITLAGCTDCHVDGIKQIGEVVSSDGVDVVGSKNVLIENCFLRNNDDCIVVKSLFEPPAGPQIQLNSCLPVENVLSRRCTLINAKAGNAMEVGFELRADTIRDIVFEDIDVIAAHGEGAVFSIHNGDRATVENVRWEDIRVEHYYQRLVDLQIFASRYSRDKERGQIRNITFKNIRCIEDRFNCLSLIGGLNPQHTVEGVHFIDFYVGDRHIMDPDALHLYIKNAKDITFE